MAIAFNRTHCGKSFEVNESLAGRRSRCKQCGTVGRIPSRTEVAVPVLERRVLPAPEASRPRKRRKRQRPEYDRETWSSLAIGASLAAFALAVPQVGRIPGVLITVIHEAGHTATAWLMGSPAVPSFDLSYGGGVSYRLARQPVLIVLIYAALVALAYRNRDDRPIVLAVLAGIVLYTAVVFSPLRSLLIIAMGHGAELILAGVFLYRALSGRQILRSAERPLYAFLGLYIIMARARFAYLLIMSAEHREEYSLAKGGGDWMDFSRIANEHLHVRLEAVAAAFLIACVLTPLAAFLFHHLGRRPW